MDPDYTITAGDIPSPLILTLRDASGAVVDLTAATVIALHVEMLDKTALTARGSTTVYGTATNGQVQYAWGANDWQTAAEYVCLEVLVTFADGRRIAFPTDPKLLIRIVPAVA